MENQHIALPGRPALIEFFADPDGNPEAQKWFEVQSTNVQANDAGKTCLYLFMEDDSLVLVTWLPAVPLPQPPEPNAALELARLIAK